MSDERKPSKQQRKDDARSREQRRNAEHDQDSEAPRTAVPPGEEEKAKRQEGC